MKGTDTSYRIQKKVKDRSGMGRWSGVVLEGKNYGPVVIAVQIAGTESATNARQAEILKAKGVLCSPRQRVYKDIRGLLAPYASDKNRMFTVVVGGDFNQTWQGSAGNVMETVKGLADSLKLDNVMAEQHGETTWTYASTAAGGKPVLTSIDHVLMSEGLARDDRTRTGVAHDEKVNNSDHRAIVVDVPAEMLIGDVIQDPIRGGSLK